MPRIARTSACIFGIFAVVLMVVGLFYWREYAPFHGQKFDEDIWFRDLTDANQSDCYRGPMVGDLKKHFLKVGMSKEGVIALLGPPEWDRYDCIGYNLGMCSGARVDYDNLQVCFDSQSNIEEVFTAQD